MSIIAFWSKEKKETGQTLSQVALSTYMAVEHNCRILSISTAFDDTTMEDCYWVPQKPAMTIDGSVKSDALEAGLEGLIKIINSNKTTNSIVSNYSRIVYKDRLDILGSPKTKDYKEYKEICTMYKDIIQIANKDYDFVFVDISKDMPAEEERRILEMADIIVVNINQRLKAVNNLYKLKVENNFFNKTGVMINVGKYDQFSKYNITNITRFIRERKSIYSIPYNTLYAEACSEGRVGEFFLKYRKLDSEDKNAFLLSETDRLAKALVYRIQELQIERTRIRR